MPSFINFIRYSESVERRLKKKMMRLIVKVCLIFLLYLPGGWAMLTEYVKWQSINYKNLPREFYALFCDGVKEKLLN